MVLMAVSASAITVVSLRGPGWDEDSDVAGAAATTSGEGWKPQELNKMNKVLDLIEQRYLLPISRGTLLDGALQGMMEALGDPYSTYMTEEEASKFTDTVQGAFTGIGADLKIDNGSVVVVSPIKGSPADRAGLQPRDVLLTVNGDSLQGMTLGEAVAKIRGPKGTKAKLKVLRPGVNAPIELELVRDRIDLETVHGQIDKDGIGRLSINQFTFDTPKQFETELKALEEQGLKSLVIDVRNNPGGVLQAALLVAQTFVPEGKPLMYYEYRDGQKKPELSGGNEDGSKAYPIFVLVNKGSASAAEVLAGALKQSAGAVLVGETTYGKGVVQSSYDEELGDGSLVKLTISKWLLPDGTWIGKKGIEPDVPVTQPAYFLATKLPRDHELKLDSTGGEIENLQQILKGVGFPADREDGYFSKDTETAVKSFQRQHELGITGIVDEKTAEKLEATLYEQTLQNPDADTQWQAALRKAREKLGIAS
ncbi:S41 family peptidase [Cohnella faecalis]|uniref:S41 family peptidase n=2 Tax=Cohnella faecalis TaxID=2315694 RepID=UPI003617338D